VIKDLKRIKKETILKSLTIIFFILSTSLFAQKVKAPLIEEKPDLAIDYKKIKIKNTKLINEKKFEVDSVSVSNDGQKVCWVGKGHNIKQIPRNTVYFTDLTKPKIKLQKVPKRTPLDAHVRCTYDINDELIVSELTYKFGALVRTFLYMSRTGEYEPYGFNGNFSTYSKRLNKKGKKSKKLKRTHRIRPLSLGHSRNTLYIKHPKVHPSGEWIVYYTHEDIRERGIYLLHRKSGTVHKITDEYDKHPTWSYDGTKILFHHQKHEDNQEKSYLGYYDIKRMDIDGVEFKRIMLDDPNMPGFIYHKHPTHYPKSNLVFFHMTKKPEGKKFIGVREMKPESKVFQVMLKNNDLKFKKAKHPHASKVDDGLFFIGKTIEDFKYKVYKLEKDGIDILKKKIKASK